MQFSNFSAEVTRKYVNISYIQETQDNLRKWCMSNGFDLTKDYDGNDQYPSDFNFHTTIFYSKTYHFIPDHTERYTSPIRVWPVRFEMLGKNNDVPVLLVESHELSRLRFRFEHQYGMMDDWPDWRPHISLSYNGGEVHKCHIPSFPLLADKISVESIYDEKTL